MTPCSMEPSTRIVLSITKYWGMEVSQRKDPNLAQLPITVLCFQILMAKAEWQKIFHGNMNFSQADLLYSLS